MRWTRSAADVQFYVQGLDNDETSPRFKTNSTAPDSPGDAVSAQGFTREIHTGRDPHRTRLILDPVGSRLGVSDLSQCGRVCASAVSDALRFLRQREPHWGR